MKHKKGVIGILTFLMLLSIFSVDSEAQTRRKKKKPIRRITVVAPVLQVPAGDAQIVSQASDQNLLDPRTLSQTLPPSNDPVSDSSARYIADLEARIKQLEAPKTQTFEERQKRMLLSLDIITRAEQRSESLRKQLFDLTEKETTLKTRIDQIDADSRPEIINSVTIFGGSLRPEETREARRKSLQSEKTNLTPLILEVQNAKTSLGRNLERSDLLLERLRLKLEKDIDDSIKSDEP